MKPSEMIKDVTISDKPNADGSYTVSIDFYSTKAEKAFKKMVREAYGRKRYSEKLGSQFLSDGIKSLAAAVDVVKPAMEKKSKYKWAKILGGILAGAAAVVAALWKYGLLKISI